MRQPPHGDPLNPQTAKVLQLLGTDPTGDLDFGMRQPETEFFNQGPEARRAHIIQQDLVGRQAQSIFYIPIRLNFHFDREGRMPSPQAFHRLNPIFIDQTAYAQMIILNQDISPQGHPVVFPTPATHGMLLKFAPTGKRFAGVIDGGAFRMQAPHLGAREGGDAGQMLQRIQGRAFS